MSDSPAADRAKVNMRQQNSSNLNAGGSNPNGRSNVPKVEIANAQATFDKTHPHPYQKR
jgi:hypothetical protein